METVAPAGRIDVISDVICPWCYIGKRQLERALDPLPGLLRWRCLRSAGQGIHEGGHRDQRLLEAVRVVQCVLRTEGSTVPRSFSMSTELEGKWSNKQKKLCGS